MRARSEFVATAGNYYAADPRVRNPETVRCQFRRRHVRPPFQGKAPARPSLSPAQRRDSLVTVQRIDRAIDSWSPPTPREQRRPSTPGQDHAVTGAEGSGVEAADRRTDRMPGCSRRVLLRERCERAQGAPGRGRGGAGGGGRPTAAAGAAGQASKAPWAAPGQTPFAQLVQALGGLPSAPGHNGGGGGGGFGGGGPPAVEPGDYLVVLEINGQKLTRKLRVEKAGTVW